MCPGVVFNKTGVKLSPAGDVATALAGVRMLTNEIEIHGCEVVFHVLRYLVSHQARHRLPPALLLAARPLQGFVLGARSLSASCSSCLLALG